MRKCTIEEMRNIANSRQGKCLSTTYTNARTNILWKCSDGHTWAATPDNVKRGTWCPYCKNVILLNEEKCRYILEWFTDHKFPKTEPVEPLLPDTSSQPVVSI